MWPPFIHGFEYMVIYVFNLYFDFLSIRSNPVSVPLVVDFSSRGSAELWPLRSIISNVGVQLLRTGILIIIFWMSDKCITRRDYKFVLNRRPVYCMICSTYPYRDVDIISGQLSVACHPTYQGTLL